MQQIWRSPSTTGASTTSGAWHSTGTKFYNTLMHLHIMLELILHFLLPSTRARITVKHRELTRLAHALYSNIQNGRPFVSHTMQGAVYLCNGAVSENAVSTVPVPGP